MALLLQTLIFLNTWPSSMKYGRFPSGGAYGSNGWKRASALSVIHRPVSLTDFEDLKGDSGARRLSCSTNPAPA